MPWHRIAKEGATTDGRTISAEMAHPNGLQL